jgi:hypothetical protein
MLVARLDSVRLLITLTTHEVAPLEHQIGILERRTALGGLRRVANGLHHH